MLTRFIYVERKLPHDGEILTDMIGDCDQTVNHDDL